MRINLAHPHKSLYHGRDSWAVFGRTLTKVGLIEFRRTLPSPYHSTNWSIKIEYLIYFLMFWLYCNSHGRRVTVSQVLTVEAKLSCEDYQNLPNIKKRGLKDRAIFCVSGVNISIIEQPQPIRTEWWHRWWFKRWLFTNTRAGEQGKTCVYTQHCRKTYIF